MIDWCRGDQPTLASQSRPAAVKPLGVGSDARAGGDEQKNEDDSDEPNEIVTFHGSSSKLGNDDDEKEDDENDELDSVLHGFYLLLRRAFVGLRYRTIRYLTFGPNLSLTQK